MFVFDAMTKVYKLAIDAINSIEDTENFDKMMNAVKVFTQVAPLNVKDSRRRIAAKLIEENKYCF